MNLYFEEYNQYFEQMEEDDVSSALDFAVWNLPDGYSFHCKVLLPIYK